MPVLGERLRGPSVAGCCKRGEPRERGIEITGRLVDELHRRRDVDRLDVDLDERDLADPGLVFDLDGVVADADDQVGRAQETALQLPARPLDAPHRQRMILIDHSLGHRCGRERQVVALDEVAQQRRIGDAHRR